MDTKNLTGLFCPSPLVYAQPTDNAVRWVFEPLNCAVRCPSNTFTEGEWVLMEQAGLFTFAATLLGSTALFGYQCYHFWHNPSVFSRLMFILGFCATSVLMVFFMSFNGLGESNITCEGEYAAIEHSPFCEFQACTMIFLLIWTEMWSFWMALECYLYVTSAASGDIQAGKYNTVYFVVTAIISAVCALTPLGVGNLGFDIETTAPFCFYMVSETTDYLFATLIYPFMLFAFGCIVLTCATIYRIQLTFVIPEKYSYSRDVDRVYETEFRSIHRESTQIRSTIQSATSNVTESPLYRTNSVSETTAPPAPYFPEQAVVSSTQKEEALPSKSVSLRNDTKQNELLYKLIRLTKRTWQYSGRQLVFVVTFTMATAFIVPTMFHAFGHNFEKWVDGTEEYATCLFVASVEYSVSTGFKGSQSGADNFAQDKCGLFPSTRFPISLVSLLLLLLILSFYYYIDNIVDKAIGIIVWYASYGLFPVLVFGIISDRFQRVVRNFFSKTFNIALFVSLPVTSEISAGDQSNIVSGAATTAAL